VGLRPQNRALLGSPAHESDDPRTRRVASCLGDVKLRLCPDMWSDRSLSANANNFGALRLLLAVLVLYSHSYTLTGGYVHPQDPLASATAGRWTLGVLAVDAFLAISGFLVAHSWERSRSLGDFLMKRVRRVYPAFVVLMLFQAFVVAPLFAAVYRPYTASQLVKIGLEIADLVGYGFPNGRLLDPFPTNPIPHEMNGSLWTIRYEFVCYVLLAGFAVVGLMKRRVWMLVIACLSIGMTGLVSSGAVHVPWSKVITAALGAQKLLFNFTSFFFSGVAFYLYRDRLRFPAILVVTASGLIVAAMFSVQLGNVLLATAGVYLLIAFAVQQRIRLAGLVRRADISYGFYLYAFPIQQILVRLSRDRLSALGLFALAAPLTAAVATASWFLVERPFLRGRVARQGDPSSVRVS
jgi:peptidoglycan/LPS O-acetylase OafA/YrhL